MSLACLDVSAFFYVSSPFGLPWDVFLADRGLSARFSDGWDFMSSTAVA